jgi:2-dehydropantoate 2-reductase
MTAIRCAVWGAGAIGGVVGAGMARAGADVLLVDIVSEHVNAMNDSGLVVRMAGKDERTRVRAALPAAVDGTFDVVFLAVKSQYTQTALDAIEPHLHARSAVVSLQNGVNEPHIARRIGPERTIGCLVDFSSDYEAPGLIARGRAGNLFVGELDGRATVRIETVRSLLAHSTAAYTCPDIMGYVWAKMCKGTIDATTALVDENALQLRFNRKYHPVRAQLVREAVQVAAAEGVQVAAFAHFDPAPFLDRSAAGRDAAFHVLDEIARGQAEGNTRVRTGYWRDIVVRKRKTEIEHITGEIVRCGERHGVPTPLNRLQWSMFEEIESGRRPMQWANLDALDAALAALAH